MRNKVNKTPPFARSLRVLVVEDEPRDAELMVAILKQAGYSLSSDVVDSPALFQSRLEQADYDMILADYNLRAWTALDVLEILQKSARDIPLVVVTGTVGDEAAVECIKQGASDYVLKHRIHRLPVVVDRVLREKAHREEAVRLEEQIRRGKQEWELTFDCVPDPILVLGIDHHIQRANRAAAKLLGLEFSQMIGRPCYEVLHGRSDPHPNCPYRRMLEGGKEVRVDIEEPRLGKIFDVTATPLCDNGNAIRGCVHVLRDVTERRRLEEQLRQGQKMEALGRLAEGSLTTSTTCSWPSPVTASYY